MRWLSNITSADVLTLINGLLGMLAITYVLDGRHVFAGMLIFMAVIVDGMDGMAARKFRKKHDFGRFLDSISDAVSFCLAPGMLIYHNYYDVALGSAWYSVPNAAAVIGSAVFVCFGLLRLARFAGRDYRSQGFSGLPTPAAAIIAILVCLLWGNPELSPFSMGYRIYPVLGTAVVLALLMISDVPYPKIAGKAAMAAGVVIALGVLVMGLYVIESGLQLPYTEAFVMLLGLMGGYLVCGPVYEMSRPGRTRGRREKPGRNLK